ncbi:MAG: hypothetical protein HQK55_17515 [Deltaproteobacteria bacterium]|nr:hypothetical protein [Deltaproteobacteria bacterium]
MRLHLLKTGQNEGDPVSSHQDNNYSLVLRLEMGAKAFIFPGDLEAEGEERLIKMYGPSLKADVLVAPHHGSAHSCTKAFLEMVRPEIVVFSAGQENRFGFPSSETLARVRRIGAQVYRTDRHGAVFLQTDGERLKVRTYRARDD